MILRRSIQKTSGVKVDYHVRIDDEICDELISWGGFMSHYKDKMLTHISLEDRDTGWTCRMNSDTLCKLKELHVNGS